jgi:hypothetical protein
MVSSISCSVPGPWLGFKKILMKRRKRGKEVDLMKGIY